MQTRRVALVTVFVFVLAFSSVPLSGRTTNTIPIKHIIVIMEENHTFDNYFGTYPGVNGLGSYASLPKARGSTELVGPFHINGTVVAHDLCHEWECNHEAYDNGKMDGFVYATSSNQTMGYFDYHQIPYYWDYASRFVLLDNFYSSVMGSTVPNHLYLMAGQSGGLVRRVLAANFAFQTIVDELDQNHVSWKYYAGNHYAFNGWNPLPGFASFTSNQSRTKNLAEPQQFYSDIAAKSLPGVVWIMPSSDQESEHPPYDISLGQRNVVGLINAVSRSDYWNSTAIFLTWDEAGGWYDHVPPPQVDAYGYGFRVPCLIISPFAKQGYIDHTQGDHTSILKFIEALYSLPPLADRDRSANNLLEAFDFSQSPKSPLLLPGLYVPNLYPLTPRQNNTKGEIIGPTTIATTISSKTAKLPDLAVTDISIAPAQPKSGDNISVTYTLKNLGDANASSFDVALYHNVTSGDYRRVDTSATLSLKAGESVTSSFSHQIRATGGRHTLTVVANDLAGVLESDSTDNAKIKTFNVQFPQSSQNYTISTVTSRVTNADGIPSGAIIVFTAVILVGTASVSFLLGMKAKKRYKTSGART